MDIGLNRMPTPVATPSESAPAPTRDVSRLRPPVSRLASTHASSPRTPCGHAIRRHRQRHDRSASTRISSVHGICHAPMDSGYSRSFPTAFTDFTVKRAMASHPHTGSFSARNGMWSMRTTPGYSDAGTYSLQVPGVWITNGLIPGPATHGTESRWRWYYVGDMKCVR